MDSRDRPPTPSSLRPNDHDPTTTITSTNTKQPATINDLTTTQPLDEKTDALSTKQDVVDDEYPSGIKLVAIVVALILAIFLASLDMTIVATAIPKITDEFGGLQDVSWYGAAFFMANGGLQSSWGKAYKYFPLKWTFLAAVFVFEVGSVVCGAAPSSTALIIGRALAGVGAAGLGTGAYTIIAFSAPPSKRAVYTGFVGMSYGIASVCGPLLGGVFSDYSTWRWCFYMNLPVGAITVVIIVFFFHAPAAAKPVEATWIEKFLQMDPVGVTLVMAAIVTYILAFQYAGHEAPWNSGLVIGLIVAFTLLYIIFGVWEYFQGDRAMLVPRLLKGRPVWVSCAYAFFFSGGYFLTIYYLPIYFQSVKGVSPTMSGVRNLPLILGVTTAMILSGFFVSATGIATPIKIVGAAIATVATGLIFTFNADTTTGEWIGYQLLGGIGWGVSYQLPIIVAQSSADPADVSTVTAMVLFFMNLGGSSFISAGQAAFVNTLIGRLPATAPGVDPLDVVTTGATDIRSVFSADVVPGIMEAYMDGIHIALVLPIVATGFAFVMSVFSKWQKLPSSATKEAAVAA